jgi:hypothetical protein
VGSTIACSDGARFRFLESPPHRLVGNILHDLELYQLVGQEPQTPASLAFRRLTAGKRDQARLLLCIKLATVLSPRRASVEGRLETLLDVLPAYPGHGRLARLHSLRDLLIYQSRSLGALVCLQQETGVCEHAGGRGSGGYEVLQLFSFSVAENKGIFLLHNELSVPVLSLSNQFSRHTLLSLH